MKKELLTILSVGLLACPIAAQAHAVIITIDPDDYAIGTNLTNVASGATLSWLTQESGFGGYNPTRSDVYAVGCGLMCWEAAGPAAFGSADGTNYAAVIDDYFDCYRGYLPSSYCYGYSVLELIFSSPTDFVGFSAAHWSDSAYMLAFDVAGNEISCLSGSISGSQCTYRLDVNSPFSGEGNTTGSIHRSQADIARVVIGAWGGWSVVNELSYSVPEPGTLALLGLGLAGLGFARRKKLS